MKPFRVIDAWLIQSKWVPLPPRIIAQSLLKEIHALWNGMSRGQCESIMAEIPSRRVPRGVPLEKILAARKILLELDKTITCEGLDILFTTGEEYLALAYATSNLPSDEIRQFLRIEP